MGLCLIVFERDPDDEDDDEAEELADCDVGHYSDFGCFRDTVARHLGTKHFPTLMLHSDCDGEWSLAEIPVLKKELLAIAAGFQKLPPEEPVDAFEHTAECRVGAKSLYDCFHDVNGENLFESLLRLCEVASENKRPITFM
jgi:hypothetical protein